MRYGIAVVALALAGCGQTVYKDRVQTVRVPVSAPCAGQRPAVVQALRDRYTDAQWQAMDVRQKAASVSQIALELRTYGEQLDAATAACN